MFKSYETNFNTIKSYYNNNLYNSSNFNIGCGIVILFYFPYLFFVSIFVNIFYKLYKTTDFNFSINFKTNQYKYDVIFNTNECPYKYNENCCKKRKMCDSGSVEVNDSGSVEVNDSGSVEVNDEYNAEIADTYNIDLNKYNIELSDSDESQ